MTHLSPTHRMQVIAIYNDLNDLRVQNICQKVSEITKERNIEISEEGVRLILKKWHSSPIFLIYYFIIEFKLNLRYDFD
jgi:Fe2+ transport system protein B